MNPFKIFIAASLFFGSAVVDGVTNDAQALHCVYNKFGESGIAVRVKWLDANGGGVAKTETVTAGQTSCSDNAYRTRAVGLGFVGAEFADVITKGSIFVGGSLVGLMGGAALWVSWVGQPSAQRQGRAGYGLPEHVGGQLLFACAAGLFPDCGGFDDTSDLTFRETDFSDGIKLKLPIPANQCELVTKDTLAKTPPVIDASMPHMWCYKQN